eukprot:TRINITY_DN12652_c0_g1_i1.p1 TRINITY_DN12652_c0_g1~~TRINITY_DN12652_c0_g1_i1.p1  ORF type:complete len:160 (-),score=33.27 TRINITY_DN12652_c0_g1_i1:68-547(-)
MLIYFGFTFCPDICPVELGKMAKAIDLLKGKGVDDSLVVPLMISIDPFRDTIERVNSYVKQVHPRLIGLTGTPQQIQRITKCYRVYSYSGKENDDDNDYLVDHSIFFYLMDKQGKLAAYYGSDTDPETLAEKIAEELTLRGDGPPPTLLERLKDFLRWD